MYGCIVIKTPRKLKVSFSILALSALEIILKVFTHFVERKSIEIMITNNSGHSNPLRPRACKLTAGHMFEDGGERSSSQLRGDMWSTH